MSGLEVWLIQQVGATLASRALQSLAAPGFDRKLLRRVRRHRDVTLSWIERYLLRRLVRDEAAWALLLPTREEGQTILAERLQSEVLHRQRFGPAIETRAVALASILQVEVLGALDLEDALAVIHSEVVAVGKDVRRISRAVDPPADPARDAFVPLEDHFAPSLEPGLRYHHRTSLIGRDAELSALRSLLGDREFCRVLIVSGRAGVQGSPGWCSRPCDSPQRMTPLPRLWSGSKVASSTSPRSCG
jgi:hypothetical protein